MVILTIMSLLTTPTLATDAQTSQNETVTMESALLLLQNQLQQIKLSVSKKVAGPVTFKMDLHEQKSSIQYRSPQQIETDIAVNHGQQRLTVSFNYYW